MISHVSLGVRDISRSRRFYESVLGPLGYSSSPGAAPSELAFGPDGQGIFWLYEVAGEGPLGSPGTHLALVAPTGQALLKAAEAAAAGGAEFTRAAGPHPDIGPDYFGAIFLDPDGHKIEVVVE